MAGEHTNRAFPFADWREDGVPDYHDLSGRAVMLLAVRDDDGVDRIMFYDPSTHSLYSYLFAPPTSKAPPIRAYRAPLPAALSLS